MPPKMHTDAQVAAAFAVVVAAVAARPDGDTVVASAIADLQQVQTQRNPPAAAIRAGALTGDTFILVTRALGAGKAPATDTISRSVATRVSCPQRARRLGRDTPRTRRRPGRGLALWVRRGGLRRDHQEQGGVAADPSSRRSQQENERLRDRTLFSDQAGWPAPRQHLSERTQRISLIYVGAMPQVRP